MSMNEWDTNENNYLRKMFSPIFSSATRQIFYISIDRSVLWR